MNIGELLSKINLIKKFISRLNNEAVPYNVQKIFVRVYAKNLNLNLNDNMIDNILHTVLQ